MFYLFLLEIKVIKFLQFFEHFYIPSSYIHKKDLIIFYFDIYILRNKLTPV